MKRRIEKLSTAKLRVVDEFLAYLEERESSEATDELLHIPGFAESLAEAEKEIATGQLTSALTTCETNHAGIETSLSSGQPRSGDSTIAAGVSPQFRFRPNQ